MSENRNEAMRAEIIKLVSRLPASHVHDLLNMLGMDGSAESEKMVLVKLTFIEHLNNLRPHRAQRLFTDLFNPFLISDPVLYRAWSFVPGAVQRIDISGLWLSLSRVAFPELTVWVQQTLDRMVASTLLDEVLRSPEAAGLQERMRLAAISYLTDLRRNRNTATSFLTQVNRTRLAEAKKKTMYLERMHELDAKHLEQAREILVQYKTGQPHLLAGLSQLPKIENNEFGTEKTSDQILNLVDDLRTIVEAADPNSHYHMMIPLTLINANQYYEPVALFIRHSSTDEKQPVEDGIVEHFGACCAAVMDTLTGILKLNDRSEGAAIKIITREKSDLEGILDRKGRIMHAMMLSGILENRRTEPMFRYYWEGFGKFLSTRVVAVLTQRITVALMARTTPVFDHQDLIWMTQFIYTWHKMAHRFGKAMSYFERWRDYMLEDIRLALDKAMKIEPGDDLDERFAHLLRLQEFMNIFERSIVPLIPVTSQNVATVIKHKLTYEPTLGPELTNFISQFLAMVRVEVGKSKNWRSPELAQLIELAEQREL
ncbi:putative DUF1631 domain-containing protein [uncultured Gammaproteobacteria bacterium]